MVGCKRQGECLHGLRSRSALCGCCCTTRSAHGPYITVTRPFFYKQLPPVAQHDIVNRSLNFVYPVTGVHTQNVESYWNHVETKFKRMKGVHADMLTSYMDEFMWRERHGTSASTVLVNLCQDISLRYPQRDVLHSLSLPLFSLLNQLFYKLPTLQKIYL